MLGHFQHKAQKSKRKTRTRRQRRRIAYEQGLIASPKHQLPKGLKIVVKDPPKVWVPYHEYLQSGWWKGRRRQALKNAGYRCERCGATSRLEVHHKNYERLWREKRKDLQVLCRPCHELRHADLIAMKSHLDSIAKE